MASPIRCYKLKASFAQASCFETTPPFFFPPLIRTLGTSKLLLSVAVLRVRKLGSSNVPSVNVIELGDAEGLLLRDRRSFRTGTIAVVAVGAGNKSRAYGCEA